MTSNPVEPTPNKKKIETIQVTLTLTKPVYEICRLLCKFEFNDDFDHYVSKIVTQDALNVKKSGDLGIFQEYAKKILLQEDEENGTVI